MHLRSRKRCFLPLLTLAAAAVLLFPAGCAASGLGTIVPAYFYPGTGGPGGIGDGWAAMAAAASTIPLIAVFNPNSGPLPVRRIRTTSTP